MAKRLVTSDLRFNRRDAQNYAKENGKTLASHRLLDEGIMNRTVRYVVQAREFTAYPASGKVFKKNEDIVDPKTKDRLPWESVKDLDIFRPGVGLFVDPKDFDTHKKTGGIVLLPASIIVLDDFIQIGNKWVRGKPDEKTMVPLTVSEELWNSLSDEERRWFYRVSQQGVRPLVRYDDVFYDYDWRYVNAYGRPHFVHGVAFEEDAREAGTAQSDEPSKQLRFSKEGGKLVVEGTPEQLDAAIALLGKLKEQ